MARQKLIDEILEIKTIAKSIENMLVLLRTADGGTLLPTNERLFLSTRTILSLSKACTPNLHGTTKARICQAIEEILKIILFEFKPPILISEDEAGMLEKPKNYGVTTDR